MLVLASNSPRRRQLLALGGWEFRSIPAEVDELPLPGEAPLDCVLRLAREKAVAVTSKAPPEAVIVAADTTVALDGRMLGKPANEAEAISMLQSLRGRRHQVFTGLVALRQKDGATLADHCVTDVTMRNYSEDEIHAYVKTGDPFDKAGAYAIQHSQFHPVERIEVCYANVVGLPLCRLVLLLDRFDIRPGAELLEPYLQGHYHRCQIATQVLPDA